MRRDEIFFMYSDYDDVLSDSLMVFDDNAIEQQKNFSSGWTEDVHGKKILSDRKDDSSKVQTSEARSSQSIFHFQNESERADA